MRIKVKPAHERARWFKDLTAAMLFAEDARQRQGPPTPSHCGVVQVHIYDGRSPHFFARYGQRAGSRIAGDYAWQWSYAKGF